MQNLTKEQEKAAKYLLLNHRCKALQIVAAAGSGKTHTMIEGIRLASAHADLSQICVITFTRKAADEMRHRLGQTAENLYFCGTMHALAYHLLATKLNILKEKNRVLKQLCQKHFDHYAYVPADLIALGGFLTENEKATLDKEYKNYKKQNNLKDFEDLLIEARDNLQANPPSNPIAYLFIDEFQDTSHLQLTFLQSLKPQKIFAVGDDWQSIYKFRGADVSISRNFSDYFQNSKRLFLSKNFRSQKRIVKLGNKIIALSRGYVKKKVTSYHKNAKPIQLLLLRQNVDYLSALKKFQNWHSKKIGDDKEITYLVRTNYIKDKIAHHCHSVLTIHSAKGLEFENVCIFALNQNQIPHSYGDPDEEIRLLYVAATRAKKRLFFVAWPQNENYSPFVEPLAKHCKIAYLDSL